MTPIGPILQSFFVDHLQALKGLRPLSIRSYRDTMRLFLVFVAAERRRKISRLFVEDFTYELAQRFLRHLEEQRRNSVRTRNQRLAIIRSFFDYLASRIPEQIAVAERVSAIPTKRTPPPETRFLERADVQRLLAALPSKGTRAQRDRALLLFLYNTGARVQETADLHIGQLDLDGSLRVRLHGKGDKWRICPLWPDTARQLRALISQRASAPPEASVFCSSRDRPLTRFGIYKIVRRHARLLEQGGIKMHARRISPHVFRHTAAVHLLESGVEVNVIRGWLGHVSLETTNRYAEINTPMKEAALRACEPRSDLSEALPRKNPSGGMTRPCSRGSIPCDRKCSRSGQTSRSSVDDLRSAATYSRREQNPDQLRAAVTGPDRYDPEINPAFVELCSPGNPDGRRAIALQCSGIVAGMRSRGVVTEGHASRQIRRHGRSRAQTRDELGERNEPAHRAVARQRANR